MDRSAQVWTVTGQVLILGQPFDRYWIARQFGVAVGPDASILPNEQPNSTSHDPSLPKQYMQTFKRK